MGAVAEALIHVKDKPGPAPPKAPIDPVPAAAGKLYPQYSDGGTRPKRRLQGITRQQRSCQLKASVTVTANRAVFALEDRNPGPPGRIRTCNNQERRLGEKVPVLLRHEIANEPFGLVRTLCDIGAVLSFDLARVEGGGWPVHSRSAFDYRRKGGAVRFRQAGTGERAMPTKPGSASIRSSQARMFE
ncbi:hypothetical protein AAFO92_07830 [Roseovarius sp. CAU 1744]